MVKLTLNGMPYEVQPGNKLIEAINMAGLEHPQICYLPEVNPIQTCDT